MTKRRWYAEFGISNYWLLNPYKRSLECLVLEGASYRTDVAGHNDDTVRPVLFRPLAIKLGALWFE